jgi:hypothetical protein
MLRLIKNRFSSDSPFRYGTRVAVSPHIRDKVFERDVLLFADPKRLKEESLKFIKDPSQLRPKAFWEILGKRTNESIHLLDGGTISVILRALSIKPESEDILFGVCRVVSDDIINRPNLASRLSRFDDSLIIAETITSRLGPFGESSIEPWLSYWADSTHQITCKDEIVRLVRILSDSKPAENDLVNLLYKKLFYRWNTLSGVPSHETNHVSLSMLLDTVNSS